MIRTEELQKATAAEGSRQAKENGAEQARQQRQRESALGKAFGSVAGGDMGYCLFPPMAGSAAETEKNIQVAK